MKIRIEADIGNDGDGAAMLKGAAAALRVALSRDEIHGVHSAAAMLALIEAIHEAGANLEAWSKQAQDKALESAREWMKTEEGKATFRRLFDGRFLSSIYGMNTPHGWFTLLQLGVDCD